MSHTTESTVRGRVRCLTTAMLIGMSMISVSGCDFIGGAETLVRGNHNVLTGDGNSDAVAKILSELVTTPEIGDTELLEILGIMRTRAAEGDMDAALVVLRLAAIQRHPQEEDIEE
jgi:hypothetical protein